MNVIRINSDCWAHSTLLKKFFLQESIMTPRSRKPVMLALFGNPDTRSYQSNISELLEESEDMLTQDQSRSLDGQVLTPQSSGDVPLNSIQLNLISSNEDYMSAANDNGLPVVETIVSNASNSSSTPESLSSAFR